MADPNPPRVKLEPSPPPVVGGTTIGGAVRTTFAPKIPARRKAGSDAAAGGAAAAGAGGASLSELITVKEERKFVPRARLASTAAPAAARVAFMPSAPGQSGATATSASGDVETREVAVVVTRAPVTRPGGGEEEEKKPARGKSAAAAATEAAIAAGAAAAAASDPGETPMLVDIEDADAAEEAELAGMLATESSYDSFLDNGDLVQYRPILLPFPKVRLGAAAGGRSSTVQRASVSASPRPGSSQSGMASIGSMFDIDDEHAGAGAAAVAAHASPVAAAAPSSRSASPTAASYKVFPAHTPARLLCQIDHEEKTSEDGGPSQNVLFFQFPSHLPFKQSATWAPPVNPLLTLNKQNSGASTSNILAGTVHSGGIAGASAPPGAPAGAGGQARGGGMPSPSLQALQNISSPMLPPMLSAAPMPNLSLGGPSAAGAASGAGGAGAQKSRSMASSAAAAAGMDMSSALGGDEEQDLGEVGKRDPSMLSESERLAREHKARQARKLLLYSSNFEHAMRHLPPGQLGSLVIYKSGKIKMRIGDILLDVNEGVQCLFHQELMSVQAGTGEAFRLGPVHHRMVCTNDVNDIVRKVRERAVPAPGAPIGTH